MVDADPFLRKNLDKKLWNEFFSTPNWNIVIHDKILPFYKISEYVGKFLSHGDLLLFHGGDLFGDLLGSSGECLCLFDNIYQNLDNSIVVKLVFIEQRFMNTPWPKETPIVVAGVLDQIRNALFVDEMFWPDELDILISPKSEILFFKKFHCKNATSDKFWNIKIEKINGEKIQIVHFGKTGTKGQLSKTPYNSEYTNLIKEKLKKGYKEVI